MAANAWTHENAIYQALPKDHIDIARFLVKNGADPPVYAF